MLREDTNTEGENDAGGQQVHVNKKHCRGLLRSLLQNRTNATADALCSTHSPGVSAFLGERSPRSEKSCFTVLWFS